jgi:hypothetical protein
MRSSGGKATSSTGIEAEGGEIMSSLWEAWADAYEEIYRVLPVQAEVSCPSYGDGLVRVAFTGEESDRIAYASVWCDNCLNGILISRTRVPAGVPIRPIGLPAKERAAVIPNYKIIPPDISEDGDTESAVL